MAVGVTYMIDGSGPFDEDEAREKIRAHCDEHGFHEALTMTVIELRTGAESGRRVDPGEFLD